MARLMAPVWRWRSCAAAEPAAANDIACGGTWRFGHPGQHLTSLLSDVVRERAKRHGVRAAAHNKGPLIAERPQGFVGLVAQLPIAHRANRSTRILPMLDAKHHVKAQHRLERLRAPCRRRARRCDARCGGVSRAKCFREMAKARMSRCPSAYLRIEPILAGIVRVVGRRAIAVPAASAVGRHDGERPSSHMPLRGNFPASRVWPAGTPFRARVSPRRTRWS
jgi:hypothetical protein